MDKWLTLCIIQKVSKLILQVYSLPFSQWTHITLGPKQWKNRKLYVTYERQFSVCSSGYWVPFLMLDEFVYFYLWVSQSGSRALSSHLFVRLQGQLDVARPLGLLLGIDLQWQGSEVRLRSVTLWGWGCAKKYIILQSQYELFEWQNKQLSMRSIIERD